MRYSLQKAMSDISRVAVEANDHIAYPPIINPNSNPNPDFEAREISDNDKVEMGRVMKEDRRDPSSNPDSDNNPNPNPNPNLT